MSENLLEIKDLSIEFRTYDGVVKAINHMSFDVPKGKTVGLVGETGAGKTTTALSVMGLVPNPPGVITSGSILFEGTDLLKLNESAMCQYRGKKIGMIFQNPMTSLNPVYTVGHQISDVIKQHQNVDQKEAWKRAGDMLEIVGIPRERLTNYPHEFSGGMKQRVCIAMGLSCNPQLLIADEPTTALDVTIQAQVLDMMQELKDNLDSSILLITHDLGVVAAFCDRVAIMYAGEIVEQGTLEDIFDTERPHHPYTIGLFGSIPNLEVKTDRLHPIDGLMPDPTDLPEGCKFNPRCPKSCAQCQSGPVPVWEDGSHSIMCHLLARKEGEG